MKYVQATCHTPGCPKNGETVSDVIAEYDVGDGPMPITQFFCGACGQEITDIVPQPESEPEPPTPPEDTP